MTTHAQGQFSVNIEVTSEIVPSDGGSKVFYTRVLIVCERCGVELVNSMASGATPTTHPRIMRSSDVLAMVDHIFHGITGVVCRPPEAPRTITPPLEEQPQVRHVTSVLVDFESLRSGGSCRKALCLCGWRGPERWTIEIASDDAVQHERLYLGE